MEFSTKIPEKISEIFIALPGETVGDPHHVNSSLIGALKVYH
jgi:hypothetical protein